MATTSLPARPARRGVLLAGLVALLLVSTAVAVTLTRDEGSGTTRGVHGSGVAASQTREVSEFAAVDVAGASRVSIRVGQPRTVVVRADDNLLELVTTDVRDGVLVISESDSFDTETPLRVDVTVPVLDELRLSGAGVMTVAGVDARRLVVSVPGAGSVHVAGSTRRLEADLAGVGELDLADLVATQADVTVSGSGVARVHVTGALDALVSGTGAVVYRGGPARVTRTVTGTGAIVSEP
jgi:hypothetical protein